MPAQSENCAPHKTLDLVHKQWGRQPDLCEWGVPMCRSIDLCKDQPWHVTSYSTKSLDSIYRTWRRPRILPIPGVSKQTYCTPSTCIIHLYTHPNASSSAWVVQTCHSGEALAHVRRNCWHDQHGFVNWVEDVLGAKLTLGTRLQYQSRYCNWYDDTWPMCRFRLRVLDLQKSWEARYSHQYDIPYCVLMPYFAGSMLTKADLMSIRVDQHYCCRWHFYVPLKRFRSFSIMPSKYKHIK